MKLILEWRVLNLFKYLYHIPPFFSFPLTPLLILTQIKPRSLTIKKKKLWKHETKLQDSNINLTSV